CSVQEVSLSRPRNPGLSLLLLSLLSSAQTPTAEFTGFVTDASGGVVAGATVVITNVATNAQRSVTTNSSGVYIAPALQPGVYSVRVSMTGFRAEVRNDIVLQVGQSARINFQLQVGEVTETVEISEHGEILDTETTTVGTVIENRRIQELPL